MTSYMADGFETDEEYDEDFKELYGIRDGILFIIDATPPMFENDPEEEIPYFLQCIRKYKEILKGKLVWNRQDWMGLTLFGTEKWDTDSDTKHILTLQKLRLISADNLKDIRKIDEGEKWKYYKDTASSSVYPLHDVLWYAARTFSAIDVTMPMRKVILFTCQDNPPLTNSTEKHRIRVQATSYSDIGVQLSIIGLGRNWNHDLFYKDLEILSEKIDTEDYERQSLKDLMEQVKLPSRNMARLPWKLGEDVIVDVAIRNLSVKTQYLKKESMSKASNVALTSCRYLKLADGSDDKKVNEHEEDEERRAPTPIFEIDIQKYQEFGDKKICFTPQEVKSLSASRKPGIDLICVKPICYEPLYHFGSPYFVIPAKSNRKDNKILFGALLNKCDARNLMIVCAVTIRVHSASNLYVMIPNASKGGFYLYKVPLKENVRQFDGDQFSEYKYNDDRKAPINPNGVELLENMIEKLSTEYNPGLFPNPKLQVQLQTIETLALDLEQRKPPPDATLRNPDEMREVVKDLLNEYNDTFNTTQYPDTSPPKGKSKKANAGDVTTLDIEDIKKLVADEKLASYNMSQLKDILKALDLKTTGRKNELIDRITEYFTQ